MSIEGALKEMEQKEYARYYFELDTAHYHLNEFKEANEAFKKAGWRYAPKPHKPEYYLSIANAYFKIHENELCQKYVDKALAIQESSPYAHVMMAQLRRRKNNNNRLEINILKQMILDETNKKYMAQMYDKIAEFQINSQQYEACLDNLNKSLSLSTGDPMAYFEKAIALYKMDRCEETIESLTTILNKQKNDGKSSKKRKRKHKDKEENFVLVNKKARANMHFLLGRAYKKNGNLVEAKKAFYVALQSSLRNAASIEIREVEKKKETKKTDAKKD